MKGIPDFRTGSTSSCLSCREPVSLRAGWLQCHSARFLYSLDSPESHLSQQALYYGNRGFIIRMLSDLTDIFCVLYDAISVDYKNRA